MSGIKIAFGLVNQGHIPTIEAELKKWNSLEGSYDMTYSKDVWDSIGKKIGWCGFTAALDYFEYLSESKKMISVDDRLPEDDENLIIKPDDEFSPYKSVKLLVKTDMGSYTDNRRLKMMVGDKEWKWFMGYGDETVTHWRVLDEGKPN